MLARDVRVGQPDVALPRAADDEPAALERVLGRADAKLGGRRIRDGLRHSRRGDRDGLWLRLGPVDHRRARLGLRLRLARLCLARLALDHPRGDPELADREVRVGLHRHRRRGQQLVLLAPRVLAQVVLQLSAAAPPRSPRTARGRSVRGRSCTRSGRRRARRRRCGGRPSPWPACARARQAGHARGTPARRHPRTGPRSFARLRAERSTGPRLGVVLRRRQSSV